MPLTHISDLLKVLRHRLMGLTILVIILSLAVSALFSHLLSTPIRALSKAAGKIASGDFSVRVSSGSNDEIQDLTEAFNEMTGQLESSFAELSHRNEELNSIISSISEGLLVLDEEGKVLLFNEGMRKITSTENILGRYYWELIRSPELNTLIKEDSENPISGEIEFSGRAFLCMITPLVSRRAKIVLMHDITEAKQIERIKKDLVVNVSHELRTPLTAIKGFTETLLEEADQKSLEYLRIIKRHTDRLIAMVEDLLVLSEIDEKPRLATEAVDLQDLVTTVLAVFDPMSREKGLDLVAGCEPVTVPGDPYRLEQLMTNLVANAVKYTEKGQISIKVSSREDHALISVKDSGIGIPREHLDRIFERFYVVDKSRSRNLGGTGLGLSIAKHIALLHGGRIEVMSTPGMGSTFTVILPLKS
jgi:two-component system, OmpR family, phosphate regulon sensor histidine kinase PhoR